MTKFLFVESTGPPPNNHRKGADGIEASGFTPGTDFEQHGAATLDHELDLLGIKYSAIVIASDFGGMLTQAELDILNARSEDLIRFFNAGGGLFASAESGGGEGLTTAGWYAFLPFVVTSTSFDEEETGNTVTPFGAGLGLPDSAVNGNYSHNVFDGTFGLNAVDVTDDGAVLSLAGRGVVTANRIVSRRSDNWLEALMDTTTLLATYALLAFLVERLTNGLVTVMGFSTWWRDRFEVAAVVDPAKRAGLDRNRRVALFVVGAVIAMAGAWLSGLDLLAQLGIVGVPPRAGQILTGLLIASGGDPIREIVSRQERKRDTPPLPTPIHVSGNLVLQQSPAETGAKIDLPPNDAA